MWTARWPGPAAALDAVAEDLTGRAAGRGGGRGGDPGGAVADGRRPDAGRLGRRAGPRRQRRGARAGRRRSGRTGSCSPAPAATWPSGSPTSTTCGTGRWRRCSAGRCRACPHPGFPYVLVADDLAPADTVGLDPATVLALVTERGSPTSHTAILARSLGLPAVVGLPGRGRAGRRDRGPGGRRRPGRSRSASTRPAVGGAAAELPDYAGPGPDRRTGIRCSCCSTSARPRTWPPGAAARPRRCGTPGSPPPRASGCSGPSCCSWTGTTCRRRPSSRPRTRRRSGPRAGGRSCCGRWTRARTSRCRSSGCGRSPTRPWAYGGCGWRGCGRRC